MECPPYWSLESPEPDSDWSWQVPRGQRVAETFETGFPIGDCCSNNFTPNCVLVGQLRRKRRQSCFLVVLIRLCAAANVPFPLASGSGGRFHFYSNLLYCNFFVRRGINPGLPVSKCCVSGGLRIQRGDFASIFGIDAADGVLNRFISAECSVRMVPFWLSICVLNRGGHPFFVSARQIQLLRSAGLIFFQRGEIIVFQLLSAGKKFSIHRGKIRSVDFAHLLIEGSPPPRRILWLP